ncbi:MAG: endo-1,4-beta-xylanase, partial [Lachnospiraceae bacterium]|nr:endo-1,4-beta-xylanase [Lachnospiraceae bacterium]
MNNNVILKDVYQDYFRIGVACEKISERFTNHEIGNPEKEALMKKQFNSMTFGNELKPAYNMGFSSPEATEDFLPFVINPQAKAMLDWAKENGMPVRGHVLVWHSQCPKEVFCKGYQPVTIPTDPELLKERPMLKHFEKLDPVCFVDRETMLKRMKSYIFSVMEYMYRNDYARTIYAWDVVNEAIETVDKTEFGLRNSYWYQVIGDDFIYWAFRFAKDAVVENSKKYAEKYGVSPEDEEALKSIRPVLVYNDYNEWMPDKKAAIIGVLQRGTEEHGSILGEGLIDGIGMQGHLSDNNDIEEYIVALKEYAALVNEV